MSAAATAITIDPSHFFREGMESCLFKAGFQPLSHAHSLAEALQALNGRVPALAAIGPNFTEPEAFALCRELLALWPDVQILLYTGHANDPRVQADAFHSGIRAVLTREAGEAETRATIAAIQRGEALFAEAIRKSRPPSLTEREREVLKWMAEGKPDREIAHEMNVSYSTARTYAQRILEKLNVHERREAVWRGRRLGWLPPKQNR
jgi:DNA-binding NarL/FixJ family response regulator